MLGPDLCGSGPTSAHANRPWSRLVFVEPQATDKVDRRGAARPVPEGAPSDEKIYREAYESKPCVLGPDLCGPGPTSAHANRPWSRLIFVEPQAAYKVDRRGAARPVPEGAPSDGTIYREAHESGFAPSEAL